VVLLCIVTCLDDLVKIHIGDQTDSKLLLGTYVATDEPGVFHWQPGVLARAVMDGKWIMVEDIDLAPAEVISVLLPLLESRELFIASRGEKVKAAGGFQIFASKSMHARAVDQTAIRENLWTRVNVAPLTEHEMKDVVCVRYPLLAHFVDMVLKLYTESIDLRAKLPKRTQFRSITVRDLLKWCHRVCIHAASELHEYLNHVTERAIEIMLIEAGDVYFGLLSNWDEWRGALEHLAGCLHISKERANWIAEAYVPALEASDTFATIGRASFPIAPRNARQPQHDRPFARTNHALCLLERIAVSVSQTEPLLLVGETGTGKTTVVQHLAQLCGKRLVVVNLSQQTESSDLLGGFKPVDGKIIAVPLMETFDELFTRTFSAKKNSKFIDAAQKAFAKHQWERFAALLSEACKMARKRFSDDETPTEQQESTERKSKRQRVDSEDLLEQWQRLAELVEDFAHKQAKMRNKLFFSFVEGSLVKAVRRGDWILLDEVNLASAETLESLSGLLQDAKGSLHLIEKGDEQPVARHPDFRVFACMNPATDVGKKDLPPGLRSRFTEFYVHSPEARMDDLMAIIRQYIGRFSVTEEAVVGDIAEFYRAVRRLMDEHRLADGANKRPHYSLRTLTRALLFVCQIVQTYGLRRSVYEALYMTFLTQLNAASEALVRELLKTHILKGVKNEQHFLAHIPKQPSSDHCLFGQFWLTKGPLDENAMDHYILTPSVKTNLSNLARVVMSSRFPVLIEGPTSAGKTSMIEYLAKRTGHRFVRINNHEHTDLQEYLGTYVSHEGKLMFKEGVLVEALRKGHWIVLDELNLAPTDVLEALNRLLDDNRELFIPETQEIVKPHPHFMLFATQNPAGLYGGRKELSRAFRNRFLELQFKEIPKEELEEILSKRCALPPSYCKRLVLVYIALQEHRRETQIFAGKQGFITLRDLFRWANRGADSYQELAEHGFMLLAERIRQDDEKHMVKQVIEQVMKVSIDVDALYDVGTLQLAEHVLQHLNTTVSWTKAMKRLFFLVTQCILRNEPVLLVGETGCGKTMVCEAMATAVSKTLHFLICHQNTETSDLLGSQRPIRGKSEFNSALKDKLKVFLLHHSGKALAVDEMELEDLMAHFETLYQQEAMDDAVRDDAAALLKDVQHSRSLFEWHDGPLVHAMKTGSLFMLDEISLADDSVLERLNSVLEPERMLMLAEKGGEDIDQLVAQSGFQFLATMNPGGDYGKKELSPALRNRFTEIWVPPIMDRDDLTLIMQNRLQNPSASWIPTKIVDYVQWMTQHLQLSTGMFSLRDMLSWVDFIDAMTIKMDPTLAFAHGCHMVFLDSFGAGGSILQHFSPTKCAQLHRECIEYASQLVGATLPNTTLHPHIDSAQARFGIDPFYIPLGTKPLVDVQFSLNAPTTADNLKRVLRGMHVSKPILLEGSPGVGKTTLITTLAAVTGHRIVRINLSEQTDISDLFGSDLPVEGGQSGDFAWKSAPFLEALQTGDWVILDEINLASQSVLEGLNSCLDYRGTIYVPELDRSFSKSPDFRLFATQNPMTQGGGRKGLPKSFLNRFTQVYVQELTADDMMLICRHKFPSVAEQDIQNVIAFNQHVHTAVRTVATFGMHGAPWEFNLRDVFRWLQLVHPEGTVAGLTHRDAVETLYVHRMRTAADRQAILDLFAQHFSQQERPHPVYAITPSALRIGRCVLDRNTLQSAADTTPLLLLHANIKLMEPIAQCLMHGWMPILVGPALSGKTSTIRLVAQLLGADLVEFSMNGSVDTMELLGAYEQVEYERHRQALIHEVAHAVQALARQLLLATHAPESVDAFRHILALVEALPEASEPTLFFSKVATILTNLTAGNWCPPSTIQHLEAHATSIANLMSVLPSGQFEWIDGVLVRAAEQGKWLLIENANLCNPSVLDRINGLLEPNGELLINERCSDDPHKALLKPHPNFRIFMTVNPAFGELSRAMRNRGVEINVLNSSDWLADTQDASAYLASLGFAKTISNNVNAHEHVLEYEFVMELLQRGAPSPFLATEEVQEPMWWQNVMHSGFLARNSTLATQYLASTFAHSRTSDSLLSSYFDGIALDATSSTSARLAMMLDRHQKARSLMWTSPEYKQAAAELLQSKQATLASSLWPAALSPAS
jgi:midasin (ATPase involved in ribosome maturation)